MKKNLKSVALLLMILALMACAGATNTTPTNVAVTAYETAGVTLIQAYSTEKALLRAGAITAAQDSEFQLGVYTKAVDCYYQIGIAAKVILGTADVIAKAKAQADYDALMKELPGFVANVVAFLDTLKK